MTFPFILPSVTHHTLRIHIPLLLSLCLPVLSCHKAYPSFINSVLHFLDMQNSCTSSIHLPYKLMHTLTHSHSHKRTICTSSIHLQTHAHFDTLTFLQEDYAQKVRLGHEEAIRQLEERIQVKIAVATNKRESEILKKLETLREHVSGSPCVL